MMLFVLMMVAVVATAQQPASQTAQQPSNSATQQPAAPPVTPPSIPGHYDGVASCANSGCHGSTQPLNAAPVLQNEYYTWLASDRHAQAYNVLFTDRSARVARNMRLKGRAYTETVCLDCHTTTVPARLVSGKVDVEDGVQCEACHGPASGWRAEHTMAGWTHEQSVARGMTDLRSLPTRASGCLSCHLGNDKREVDHELIASGHPILAFELDNYTETMPAHWRRSKDSATPDTHGARAFAVGQAAAFSQSLDNLARHARGEVARVLRHELHQLPPFAGDERMAAGARLARPGRTAGVEPAALGGAPSSRRPRQFVSARAARQRRAVDRLARRPHERHERCRAGCRRCSQDHGRRHSADRRAELARDDVRTLMRTITGETDFILTSDVHSAEQTALALQSLASALTRNNPRLLKSPMTEAIDGLFAEIQNRERYEPARFVQKLAALRAVL